MKRFNIIVLGALTVLGLASCELKNELLGNGSDKAVTGTLELGVSVQQPGSQTRATTEVDDFPVIITGASAEVSDVHMEYAAVSEMPASIVLPVGTYTVSSHSPGELDKQMNVPYYGGSSSLVISKDITTSVDVICKMRNSRIQLTYGEDFKTAFQSWTITIDDGSSSALSYKDDNTAPSPIYWNFDEEAVRAITVNIRATTTEGNTVNESRTFQKSDAAEKYEDVTEFFKGGDALVITMGAIASSTGSVNGITISTSIIFENHDEEVPIPVDGEEEGGEEGGGDNPGGETGNGPTITFEKKIIEYSLSDDTTMPSSADANIAASAGLKSVKVTIIPGNEVFGETISGLMNGDYPIDFINGAELVNNENINGLFTTLGMSNVQAPSAGDKTYTFPIGAFFMFLNLTGATDAGKAHEFAIEVTDMNEAKTSDILKIYITE